MLGLTPATRTAEADGGKNASLIPTGEDRDQHGDESHRDRAALRPGRRSFPHSVGGCREPCDQKADAVTAGDGGDLQQRQVAMLGGGQRSEDVARWAQLGVEVLAADPCQWEHEGGE
jgi:hypothetical protein